MAYCTYDFAVRFSRTKRGLFLQALRKMTAGFLLIDRYLHQSIRWIHVVDSERCKPSQIAKLRGVGGRDEKYLNDTRHPLN